MKSILTFAVLFFSVSTFANADIPQEIAGVYDTESLSLAHENDYLNCENGKLSINIEDNNIVMSGISTGNIVIDGIGEGTVGVNGLLLHYSQRRSERFEIENGIGYRSKQRTCRSGLLLKDMSCIGVPWLQTTYITFQDDGDQISGVLKYKPFEQMPEESCTFSKKL